MGRRLWCEDPVLVFRPGPDAVLGHVCEPRLTRLPSGPLLLSHRLGSGRVSADGTIQLLSSTDGVNWHCLGRLFSNLVDGRPGDFQTAPIATIGSGDVV